MTTLCEMFLVFSETNESFLGSVPEQERITEGEF